MTERDHFARDGFVLFRGLLDPDTVAAGQAALRRSVGNVSGAVPFPFAEDALNDIALSPAVLGAIASLGLTGLPTVRGSVAVLKTGGTVPYAQPLHLENKEYSLVVPTGVDDLRGVVAQVYLSEAGTDAQGPTAAVPLRATAHRDVATEPFIEPPGAGEYDVEQHVYAGAGDILFFGYNTYHRGTGLDSGRERLSMQVSYSLRRTSESTVNTPGSMSYDAWTRLGELIPRLGWEQLSCLGFPPRDDPYWTPHTRAAVERRYPGLQLA